MGLKNGIANMENSTKIKKYWKIEILHDSANLL